MIDRDRSEFNQGHDEAKVHTFDEVPELVRVILVAAPDLDRASVGRVSVTREIKAERSTGGGDADQVSSSVIELLNDTGSITAVCGHCRFPC